MISGKLALLTLIVLGLNAAVVGAIDPFYHTIAEIDSQIHAYQSQYPTLVRVDSIGHSQEDSLPIWAVKLSDNVQTDEDEPTVLLVGQVHAEEVLGVEIVMALMDTILTKQAYNPYHTWLQKLELWIIPTANPEGHQVVMDSIDFSYRKNKHDNNGNGIFDFQVGTGWDIDGVDINRNFPLNWVHGDTFLQGGGAEPYDYFRGPYPLSEAENQALWILGAQEKFSFSIVWHSSRTGNYSENVYYPWNWDNAGKIPAGFDAIETTAIEIANLIPKLGGGDTYDYSAGRDPRGNQHDSFYAFYNTIAFLIECGNATIQPLPTVALQVIEDNFGGTFYLLNRAATYSDLDNHAQITGKVKDSANNPLPAVVEVEELDGYYLEPRTCEPLFGRYRRYVEPGIYNLRAHLRGYYAQDSTYIANPSGPTPIYFTLQSKPTYTFGGMLQEVQTGNPLAGTLLIHGEDVDDTLSVNSSGQFSHVLPEGYYQLTIISPGYVVRFNPLWHHQNSSITYQLSPQTILFNDNFESGLSQWTHGGFNDHWGTEAADSLWAPVSIVVTESPGGDYQGETESWLQIAGPLNLSAYATASLSFQHWYYFEPGYDNGRVQASIDGGQNWETIAGLFDRQDIGPEMVYANLDPYCGQSLVLMRWRVWSDSLLHNQGWRIDNVVIAAADTAVYGIRPPTSTPTTHELLSVYPNPFNSQISFQFNLDQAQRLEVSLWDLAGREVARVYFGTLPAGVQKIAWQMPVNRAAGIYWLKVQREAGTEIRKILYLK